MKLRFLAALVVFGLAVAPIARGAAETPAAPVVVELFTSQSCYSCPPAEAYLGRLAGRADVVALEFHVDYWNDLVYGTAGKWIDPHSSPAFMARQRAYAQRFPDGVYTPQMVIDGRLQAIGSRERDVEAAIKQARTAPHLTVRLVERDAGKIELQIEGPEALKSTAADIWLVRFKQRDETKIRAGENRGKSLVNHHVVTNPPVLIGRLDAAVLDGDPRVLDAGPDVRDDGCAVLIQAAGQGPILGAAFCPGAGKAT
jgi:hypothetical protein